MTAPTSYMTTAEVADLMRTSSESVRYWRSIGKGPKSFKVGRKVLYETEVVLTWIEEAKQQQYAAYPQHVA